MTHDVIATLSDILTTRILEGPPKRPITRDTALLSSGLGLDSVSVLELVIEVETAFGVQFQDTDLSVQLFQSVGSLADAIERKLASSGARITNSP